MNLTGDLAACQRQTQHDHLITVRQACINMAMASGAAVLLLEPTNVIPCGHVTTSLGLLKEGCLKRGGSFSHKKPRD